MNCALNARYYHPKLAMLIQPDWWEVMQAGVGTNRYGYSGGDPVNGSDPKGNLTFTNDAKPLSKEQQETLQKDADKGRDALDSAARGLRSILDNGGHPTTQGEQDLWDDLERAKHRPRGGISEKEVKQVIAELEKVRDALGDHAGVGAKVINGGSSKNIFGPGYLVPASAIPRRNGKIGTATITVYDEYFQSRRTGYELAHEFVHNVLGLLDTTPTQISKIDNRNVFANQYQPDTMLAYRWGGVDIPSKITDSVTCLGGFRDCGN